MKELSKIVWVMFGIIIGFGFAIGMKNIPTAVAGNDRHEDFVMATGPVLVSTNAPTDGVWLLDYKSGKLQGSVIDRFSGKIVGWAELDLAEEFNLPPRQNVHFVMTTGIVGKEQSALYVAETTTGKIGVYTMGPRPDGLAGAIIKRQDLSLFRKPK